MDAEVTAAFAELKAENAQLSKDVAQLHNHLQHLFADSQGRTHRLRTWLGWQDGKGSLDAPSDVTHKQGQRA